MQNKNYFSLSWPLIRECFKMYWYIPALSFVMYFFAGIFPGALKYETYSGTGELYNGIF